MKRNLVVFFLCILTMSPIDAQIGKHRNDFSIGASGGYLFSRVGFSPTVTQKSQGGMMAGITLKYLSEKYFNTFCSIYIEVNYAQLGWKDNILDKNDKPVINKVTGLAEKYSRTINYIQIPFFAHLAWGKERKGMQFFVNLGPQFGYYLSEKINKNFDNATRNMKDRSNTVVAQDTMAVKYKFDYGVAAGLGLEYYIPKVGSFLVEGRYYYGLGNIFGNTKRDYFGKSNYGNIVLKLTYLFNISKTI